MRGCSTGIGALTGLLLITAVCRIAAGQSLPGFDRDLWVQEQEAARAKMIRGAGLAFMGSASIVPLSILINKSTENPTRYLGWTVVMGIATAGMLGHGIGSIGFGGKQKKEARGFIADYDEGTADAAAQKDAWLYTRRKSAIKTSLFGSVLTLTGVILLANGIVRTKIKRTTDDLQGVATWPDFVTGGLLLPVGVLIIAMSVRRYREYRSLDSAPLPAPDGVALLPFWTIHRNCREGGVLLTWPL